MFIHCPAPPCSPKASPFSYVPEHPNPNPVTGLHSSAHTLGEPWESTLTARAPVAASEPVAGPGPCCLPWLPPLCVYLQLAFATTKASAAGPCSQVCTPPTLTTTVACSHPQLLDLGGITEDTNNPCRPATVLIREHRVAVDPCDLS